LSTYNSYQIQQLSQIPQVRFVNENEIVLDLRYKQELYDLFHESSTIQDLRERMESDGLTLELVGSEFYRNHYKIIKNRKRPKSCRNHARKNPPRSKKTTLQNSVSQTDTGDPNVWKNYVSSGKFFVKNETLYFSNRFLCELFSEYPETTIEKYLLISGFEPSAVGWELIHKTDTNFKKYRSINSSPMQTRDSDVSVTTENIRNLQLNPLVERATPEEIVLKKSFFQLASVFHQTSVDSVLDIFMLNHLFFTLEEKMSIKRKLMEASADSCLASDYGNTLYHCEILRNRMMLLMEYAEKGFERIRGILPALSHYQKKLLCQWISKLPPDPGHAYNKSVILSKICMSRTLYYLYVGSDDFGMGEIRKQEQDESDAKLIKEVVDYKGFKKGSRQIYMLLPKITGKSFSISKIRRLMKAYGMESGIRKRSNLRKAAREREAAHVKPNLLKRMFRLHRPNEVRVTDVTYLDYGDDMRAYGSALMDPVTSRLIAFVVSENNDLELALETIRQSDNHPCIDGGIFHSDQGILYKTDEFQKEVLDRGFDQSMSKKGNCWDNATQESFFGHFKDECDYSSCNTLNELKKEVEKYADYYNNERGMWERRRMTPVEYEEYLLSLSPEEFGEYLAAEKKKYEKMKKNAAQLAKQHAKTLGV